MRTTFRLPVEAAAALVASAGVATALVVAVLQVPRIDFSSRALLPAYLFALLLMAGELRPLLVARDDGDTDTVTVSTTFAVVLILCGPLVLAMAAQALAVGYDDLRRGKSSLKTAFNLGQYLVTLAVARGAFSLMTGRGFLATTGHLRPLDVMPGLAAGAIFFVVNNGLVAWIMSLATGERAVGILRGDLRAQGLASSILIGLAPVAAILADFSLATVPLTVLPMLGVQHSAHVAARRHHEALHDGLTGLPNRSMFQLRATAAIGQACEDAAAAARRAASSGRPAGHPSGRVAALMLLDLDHFKEVNDTLGHLVGDALLREVAARLTSVCPEAVTVSRLGGDEFAILVPGTGSEAAEDLANRISDALRRPAVVDGVRIAMQASIGVALAPTHGRTVDGLLQRADIALYRAKVDRGSVEVYREEIDTHTVQRLNLVADLHTAVDDAQVSLAFQPLVDAATRKVVGLEALARWNHPTHGAVPPGDFIPLAERSGAISSISYYVIDDALASAKRLILHGHHLSMSINLSARLLTDLHLADAVAEALFRHDIPAGRLTIEVTESTIAADPNRAMAVLHDLRSIGVRLSVDDFGTGYSSLAYLSRLRPDELKIDRSFVAEMHDTDQGRAIVLSTIELGHSLGMEVVAEGVEDEETYAALLALGCDRIQGYLIGRPIPEAQLTAFLDETPAVPADATTPAGTTPDESRAGADA